MLNRLKMSYEELARKLNVNLSTVYRWGYKGNVPVKYHEELKRICLEKGVPFNAKI